MLVAFSFGELCWRTQGCERKHDGLLQLLSQCTQISHQISVRIKMLLYDSPLPNISTPSFPENAIWGPQKPSPRKCRKVPGFLLDNVETPRKKADPGNSGKFVPGIPNGHFGMIFLGGPKLICWAQGIYDFLWGGGSGLPVSPPVFLFCTAAITYVFGHSLCNLHRESPNTSENVI